MRLRVGMWSAAVVLCLAGGCSQDHAGLPRWRVGQWVEYDVTSGSRKWRLEYAVVGEEKNGGSRLFWLEARKLSSSDSLFVKCLVPSGLDGPAEKVLVGGNGLSSHLLVSGSHLPWKADARSARSMDGRKPSLVEEIDTPVGRFQSERFDHAGGQIWLCSEIPVFGVVRSKNVDVEMVLVAYGHRGATSELKDAPESATVLY